jgi:hypothetical protein
MEVHQTSKAGLGINVFAESAVAITAGATVYAPSLVYVGTSSGGSVTVTTANGQTGVVFKNLIAGTVLPVLVISVTAATASDLVLLS